MSVLPQLKKNSNGLLACLHIPILFVHPESIPAAEGRGGDQELCWHLAMVIEINWKDRNEDLGVRDSAQEFLGKAENGILFRSIASTVGVALRSCSPGTTLSLYN